MTATRKLNADTRAGISASIASSKVQPLPVLDLMAEVAGRAVMLNTIRVLALAVASTADGPAKVTAVRGKAPEAAALAAMYVSHFAAEILAGFLDADLPVEKAEQFERLFAAKAGR